MRPHPHAKQIEASALQMHVYTFKRLSFSVHSRLCSCVHRFGAFYCPMLPVIAVLKLVVLFYVKKYATLRWCSPPERAFKATHSLKGLIYFVMLMALLCVSVPLGYIIIT